MDEIEKLKSDNENLRKTNAVKSDLISISAHQLRTSLSALKWILKMFIDEDLGKLTSEQENFIKKAFDSNERMIKLVNDLLTLNHAEDTTIPFKVKKVDILSIIEQTVFEFSGELNKKGINLILLKPNKALPAINCDEEMIRVVIQNLIENAIKYSAKNDKVFVSIKQADAKIEISVRDTGIGIDPKDKDEIFKKFFRAENAKEKDSIGSGLGLFATRNIVEKHNGKIWFETKLSEGTTFFVSLPIT